MRYEDDDASEAFWKTIRDGRLTPDEQRIRETRELLRLCRQSRRDREVALWVDGIIVEREPGSSLASGWRLFCELHHKLGNAYTPEAYAAAHERGRRFRQEVSVWSQDQVASDKNDVT